MQFSVAPSFFTIRRNVQRVCLFLAVVALMITGAAYASEGVFLFGNDPVQMARGSSGIASPRTAYWAYMNPASIVDLERRADVACYTVFTDIKMKPKGLIGNTLDDTLKSQGMFNIVSGGVILPLEKGTLGFGMYIPSGTGVDYPHSRNILQRITSNADRRLTYEHIRLVGAYGYEFDNGWALGFGLHTSVTRFRTDHITLGLSSTQGSFEWDEALGAGFNIGVYKAWEKWAIGGTYTSRHWTQKLDSYADLLDNTLDTPHIFHVGVGYKVTPKLELTADYKFLWWKEVGQYGGHMFDCGFNWDNQHGVKFGLEYKASEKWVLMAGFAHSNTPVDRDHAFLSGLVPVTVEDHITAGCTYHINENHEVHLTLINGLMNTVKDSGRGDLFSRFARGSEIMSGGKSFVLGYSYKW